MESDAGQVDLDAGQVTPDAGVSSADGGQPLCEFKAQFTAHWELVNGNVTYSTTGLHNPKFSAQGLGLMLDLERPLQNAIAQAATMSQPDIAGTLTITPTKVILTYNPPIPASVSNTVSQAVLTLLSTDDPTKRVLAFTTRPLTAADVDLLWDIGLASSTAQVGMTIFTAQGIFARYYCMTGLPFIDRISD